MMMEESDHRGVVRRSLAEIGAGAARLDDEVLAERIEHAGAGWLARGEAPGFCEFLESIPILRSRPISLDACIDIALRGLMEQGRSLEEATTLLLAEAPELAEAIQAHVAIRSLLGTLGATGPGSRAGAALDELPAPFGPLLGDERHRYQLEERKGSGAEGTVYRALDRRLSADGRPLQVAVKLLHARSDGTRRAVADEAARAMRVRHPRIAALLDYGNADDQPYLVYDFVEGESLDRWRKRKAAVEPREAAQIVATLAEAVQAAHNAGVVHRDLKPTNVLIDKAGDCRITDFGLAAAISETTQGDPVGSLGFAPPEQLLGEPGAEDAAVDVYALGGMLYWLLTGRFPNGDSPQAVRDRLAAGFPLDAGDPRSHVPALSPTLAGICRKAMTVLPEQRYSSPGLLRQDLARWLGYEPVLPFDQSITRRLSLWTRRSPRGVVAAAVVIVAVAMVLWAAWRADVARRNAEFRIAQTKQEAEIERLELEHAARIEESARLTQESRMQAARGIMAAYSKRLSELDVDAESAHWLPGLAAVQEINERLDLLDGNDVLYEKRIQIVHAVLAHADQTNTRDAAEMVIWETNLGLWHLILGSPEKALPVLTVNRERALEKFGPNDPWTKMAGALADLATLLASSDSSEALAARARLEAAPDTLPPNVAKLIDDALLRVSSQTP